MRFLLLILVIPFYDSCRIREKSYDFSRNASKVNSPINDRNIYKIELLIADTSIWEIPDKQFNDAIWMGEGLTLVDSFGKSIHTPTQRISFEGIEKDSLVAIFINLLHTPKKDIERTSCITLFRHVFLLYNTEGEIAEQVNVSLDCPVVLNYIKQGIVIRSVEESGNSSTQMHKLISILNSKNAFINVSPPPPPPLPPQPPPPPPTL